MRRLAEKARADGEHIVVLSFDEEKEDGDYSLGSRDDLSVMAHTLFRHLRAADDEEADRIYAPEVEKQGWGLAIMNRLEKAAGRNE